MQLALVTVGSGIISLVIAGTQNWSTSFELIRRTNLPARRTDPPERQGKAGSQYPSDRQDLFGSQSQPGIPSQSRISPSRLKSGRSSSMNLPDDLMPSVSRGAKISIDVHGPGKFNGWPNPSPDTFDTHVERAQRRSKMHRGMGEVAADGLPKYMQKAISDPYLSSQKALHHRTTMHMVKMESAPKKVEQSVSIPRRADGQINVLSPGELIPGDTPVPANSVVKVTAQMPDEKGIRVQGTAQSGGKVDAHITDAEGIRRHRIEIGKP